MTARAVLSLVAALFLVGGGEHARIPFTEAMLTLEADAEGGPAESDAPTLAALARIAELARAEARGGSSRAEALNRAVFERLGFVREVNDPGLKYVFLSSVVGGRRGSCVGLGALYIALGELLGWHVEGVMVPGHFYVRVGEDGRLRNVELLRRGEEMPDSWYRARFPVPGHGAPEYRRALTTREVLGVVEYDVGNQRRRQARFSEARRAYALSASLFPRLSEAHASLGATEQLLGALDDALASYRAARRENPDLPGVDHNMELVQEELAGRAAR